MDKALLLVVDVQRGFVTTDEIRAVVPCINTVINRWHSKGWPIAYSRFVNPDNSNWERLRDWHELKGEPDTLLHSDLAVKSANIFKKNTYNAWSTETAQICNSEQVHHVVLVGIDTNECVLATALGVFDAGLTPWVLEDCCASSGGEKPHSMALTLMRALLGEQQVLNSKELTV